MRFHFMRTSTVLNYVMELQKNKLCVIYHIYQRKINKPLIILYPLLNFLWPGAVHELRPGKSPGLDCLSLEFYRVFWDLIGEDLYAVFLESFNQGKLPLSCWRAVVTLILKKGDLGFQKNWRPVLLICVDLKMLSKTITNRLKKYVTNVTHEDQSFCVPKCSIFNNLFLVRDMITVAQRHKLDIGFLSLDQEKAFDRVDHHCLFKTLEAFGFGTHFISLVKLLYNDIYSMLRINGSLTRPFPLTKGIRQGCPLSGLLYFISNEPLLAMLRKQLCGFGVSGFSEVAQWHFSTVWYGMVRFSTVDFWGVFHWVQYLVPGSFFSTTSAEVPSDPYRYQNVMCKLC